MDSYWYYLWCIMVLMVRACIEQAHASQGNHLRFDEFNNPLQQGFLHVSFGLAFPNDEALPVLKAQLATVDFVALDVVIEFLVPELSICARLRDPIPASVSMPKAPVDEDHLSEF